jgi:hypothetical protein
MHPLHRLLLATGLGLLGLTVLPAAPASAQTEVTPAPAPAPAPAPIAAPPAARRPPPAPRPEPARRGPEAARPLPRAAAAAPIRPAETPPPAPRLAVPAPATPPAVPADPPLLLPPGMAARPEGGWRLRFAAEAEEVPPAAIAALAELGRRLAARPTGRITLLAQASGPTTDASLARRLTLARGLAVKQALAGGGLPATRIDIRPLGRIEEATDAVDIQPPEPERAAR